MLIRIAVPLKPGLWSHNLWFSFPYPGFFDSVLFDRGATVLYGRILVSL